MGRRLTLDAPLVNGRGHARVGRQLLAVIADEDFAAASKVEVIAVEGITATNQTRRPRAATGGPPPDAGCPAGERPRPRPRGPTAPGRD
ncbi:hypothetical protein CX680_31165, partial [Klebsiella pneumoniae]